MPAESAILKNLQKQCKAAGLDTKGIKGYLVKRLEQERNREVPSPESQDDTTCDAILIV